MERTGLTDADTSPLGRDYWTYEGVAPRNHALAALTGILMGVHAISRVLANSEAFRVQNDAEADVPPERRPLDTPVAEGLFAALHFLTRHAQEVAEELLEQATLEG